MTMNSWCLPATIALNVARVAFSSDLDPNGEDDYSNPEEYNGGENWSEYGNEYKNDVSDSNLLSLSSTEAPILSPDSTFESYLMNDDMLGSIDSSTNDSSIPLPIIIVFIFMFTMLGVICIQQLQRMFAENKEYNNIKFDIRENRPTLRSGKSYGTVNNNNKNRKSTRKHKHKQGNDKQTQISEMNSFQNSSNNNNNTIVTILSETDEKVQDNNSRVSSDDSIELGSGYDSNVNPIANNNNNNKRSKSVGMDFTSKQKHRIAAARAKTSEKLKRQMRVATQGLKDKIEQKLHGGKLNNKKNKYKGYGTLTHSNNEEGSDNDVKEEVVVVKKKRSNSVESDDSDVKHDGYSMNYGHSEDYDCDFEDSDTQLSEEGDDCPMDCNETVIKRVILE